eukprot:TRINITY_DN93053_c0_g1_i1.p1 TRINITY_DN93053_c0_g1~~TRINITY_DN93053_c0_g1_i1.p1  ORF type:complete len:322 (-),score=37.83 TRINITY_DN93053_c0_g1_i1:175-1140(-)
MTSEDDDAGSAADALSAALNITVAMCSGASAELSFTRQAACEELLSAAEQAFGLERGNLLLRSESPVTSIDKACAGESLESVGLRSGMVLTAFNMEHLRLALFPEKVDLKITTTRSDLGQRRFSSQFVQYYHVALDCHEETLRVEPWRKNDHDVAILDFRQKIKTVTHSHWMAGTQTHEADLAVAADMSLGDMCQVLRSKAVPLLPEERRFWRPPGQALDADHPILKNELDPEAAQGWFVLPDEVAIELKVGLSLEPVGGEGILERILINTEGMPIRLAIDLNRYSKGNIKRESLEEYKVEVISLDRMEQKHTSAKSSCTC